MPKEAAAGSSQSGLIYLKYTFRYKDQFDEPNDDWLDCIEATSDELLGAYTRAKDDAMTLAFVGQDKKRLNRVFDVIGFVYPDYRYPSQKQGRKRKYATSAIASTPKQKKVTILTHRPKRAKAAKAPKPVEGPSTSGSDCPTRVEAKGKSVEVPEPKVITEQQKAETTKVPKRLAEVKAKTAEELNLRKSIEQPKILSLSQETELPKISKMPAVTPKRRRMACVLDTVIESTKVLTPASLEVPSMGEKITKETTEAGPPASTEANPAGATLILEKESASEKVKSPIPEAPAEELDFIIRHSSGKQLSEEHIIEAKQYARDLKYPKGSLVFNGTDEDNFLYCLPDNKEISICREMTEI
jgi:hypothetical protein